MCSDSQDTPSVKFLYTAAVTVAKPLTALMSANLLERELDSCTPEATSGPPQVATRFADTLGAQPDKLATFEFEQGQPVPAYLLALAVGFLERRRVGPRSHIWAEPSIVEAAAWEFEETESFLAAGVLFST